MRNEYGSQALQQQERAGGGSRMAQLGGNQLGAMVVRPSIEEQEAQLRYSCFQYAMDLYRGKDAVAHQVVDAAREFYEYFRPFLKA